MKENSLLDSFVIGSKNLSTTDISDSKPLVVRGVTSKTEINQCQQDAKDFYYIDTGYLGNFPSPLNPTGKKVWHRVVKNDLQHSVSKNVPNDRWNLLLKQNPILEWKGWKNFNQKILLVLPNPKACRYYNIDADSWITETTEKIKSFSNLPIETRVKGSRSERNHGYSIYKAFDSGVYATVSFNSIASLESALYGIPSFVSVPCAASPLASTDLSLLKNPFKPSMEEISRHCNTLAYGQFRVDEIENGIAWKILNGII